MKRRLNDLHRFMDEALAQARKGLCSAHPNPRVGCIFVKENTIIASGYHQKTGGPHAERVAIANATESLVGATCFVTLEPCSHQGRTPPCVHALIDAGIERCVIATNDPNPLVNGAGVSLMEQAGIEVIVGVREQQALDLNRGFFKRMQHGKPWVSAKVATSLDGKTAMQDGQSQWITSAASREDVHFQRAQSGAILSSYKTVNADDAQLTARGQDIVLQPLRVIVDANLSTNPNAKVFSQPGQTLLVVDSAHTEQLERYQAKIRGECSFLALPTTNNRFDWNSLLRALGQLEINDVWVEAGQGLLGSLLQSREADCLVQYVAPKILGSQTLGMIDLALPTLEQHLPLEFTDVERIGDDLKITAMLRGGDGPNTNNH